MKLRFATMVEGVEHLLREKISPLLEDDFALNDIRMAGSLLALSRLAREDEVALKVEEHGRLRALFTDAAEVIDNAALADRLRSAAVAPLAGLRLSELDAETGRLRSLLVELHADVEVQTGDEARRINRDIWTLLRDIEAQRAPKA